MRRRAPPDSNARSLAPPLPGACRIIEAGHGSAGLSDKTGRPRVGFVTLGLVGDGEPRMALLGARGGTVWKAP